MRIYHTASEAAYEESRSADVWRHRGQPLRKSFRLFRDAARGAGNFEQLLGDVTVV